ncbi:hypothetical protein D9M69_601450 [compost metagenome]
MRAAASVGDAQFVRTALVMDVQDPQAVDHAEQHVAAHLIHHLAHDRPRHAQHGIAVDDEVVQFNDARPQPVAASRHAQQIAQVRQVPDVPIARGRRIRQAGNDLFRRQHRGFEAEEVKNR